MNAAIILAAGDSTRLGHPKQLVEAEGEPLVARTVRVARSAGLVPYVVTGANADRVESLVDDAVIVRNEEWSAGLQTSIAAGVARAAADGAATVTVIPCDLPRLRIRDVERLVARSAEAPIVAAAYDGVAGAPATFAPTTFEALRALPPGEGARSLIRGGQWPVVEVPIPAAAHDVDTPEDLEALR